MLQRGGELVSLFHPGSHWTAAGQHQDIPRLDAPLLNCGDSFFLADENSRWTFLAVHAIGIDRGWVDGGALNDSALGGQVASWKGDCVSQPPGSRALRSHNHVVGIHRVFASQKLAEPPASLALLPPVQ